MRSCDGSWRLNLPSVQGRVPPRRCGRSNWVNWLEKNPHRRSSGRRRTVPEASGVARVAKTAIKAKAGPKVKAKSKGRL